MPTPRQEVAAVLLDGEMYVLGGLLTGGLTSNAVEIFNPETNQWRTGVALPRGIHHGSAAVLDGKIYSVGGFGAGQPIFATPIVDVYEFDPQQEGWQARASLPSVRGSLFTVALGGRLYAIGGRDVSNSNTNVTVYDPQQDQWSSAASLPVGLDHLAAAALDGKIYVAGGRVTQGGGFVRNDDASFVYDPDADEWTPIADLPTARSGHAAIGAAGFLLVIGGEIPGVFGVNEVYDPAQDRWFALPDLPTPRHGLGIVASGDRIFTAGGGTRAGFEATGQSEVFNVLGEVSSLPQMAAGPDITSRLVLGNPGPDSATVMVEFHSGPEGTDRVLSLDGQSASQFQRSIEPEGVVTLTTDPEPSNVTAGVTVYSNAPLLGNVLFSGPLGFAGVASTRGGTRLFLNASRQSAEGADSGVALSDLSGVSGNVVLTLLASDGAELAQAEISLQGFGHTARFLSEIFGDGLPEDFTGSLRIESEGRLGAVAILVRPGQFATLPVRVVE
ncbi:MAG TPA: kelch repeat-containing protein [Acidobacteriota bacterium]|nr:kelch repeat-containing protein [Acidobacteriota bacterium]